ncbi:unnamed protein product [Coregonus sp. 'balchen']|nr:unnamed protein product [Coregonus sp. 'balchen']
MSSIETAWGHLCGDFLDQWCSRGIHPRDKQDVAYRLSLGARAVAYGEEGVSFQGPFPNRILVSDLYINIFMLRESRSLNPKISFRYGVVFLLTMNRMGWMNWICCSGVRAPCDALSLWVPAPILQWGVSAVQLSTTNCFMNNVAGLRYA